VRRPFEMPTRSVQTRFPRRAPKFLGNLALVTHAWPAKPRLIARSARFFALKALGIRAIRGVDLAVSFDCNLQCAHCNVAGERSSQRTPLGVSDIAGIVRQVQDLGGFYVTFTGGEPLLKLDAIEEVISAVGRGAMLWQVQTNGTLLDAAMCGRLRAAGVDNVQISFDTYHEAKTWEEVLRTKERQVAMLTRVGIRPILTWLASHASLADEEALARVIDFSIRHKVAVGMNMAVPQGRWQGTQDGILLTPQDSRRLRELSERHRYLFIDLQNSMFRYGCPAFSERFYINAYGDVQPCTFFQISFGNALEEPLRDIWKRGLEYPLFAGFPDRCPPAEDKEFLERWFARSQGDVSLPIPYREFFD
jgi:MoaA/NifB/PqqE/SkfB family radical SAM enzyme